MYLITTTLLLGQSQIRDCILPLEFQIPLPIQMINIVLKTVNDYTHLETSQDSVVVPWIQQIALNNVVLRGYLGMTNIDKVIDEVPSMINNFWLISKELDCITARQDENLIFILETKFVCSKISSIGKHRQDLNKKSKMRPVM
ncbi:1421_t:CDS:2 [Funneliformis mosseae]|uniref:1421_t:CDS:1 n=1 Tax=Funneliformis mosseae TaxID=27381 RepID=A0A9N8WBJ2_FUNMO|nr:1421_t:CDS:2 [Funneliformis mosseae]